MRRCACSFSISWLTSVGPGIKSFLCMPKPSTRTFNTSNIRVMRSKKQSPVLERGIVIQRKHVVLSAGFSELSNRRKQAFAFVNCLVIYRKTEILLLSRLAKKVLSRERRRHRHVKKRVTLESAHRCNGNTGLHNHHNRRGLQRRQRTEPRYGSHS